VGRRKVVLVAGDVRPAVVLARLDQVDLVVGLGPVLGLVRGEERVERLSVRRAPLGWNTRCCSRAN